MKLQTRCWPRFRLRGSRQGSRGGQSRKRRGKQVNLSVGLCSVVCPPGTVLYEQHCRARTSGSCSGAFSGRRALLSLTATRGSGTRLHHLSHCRNSQAQLGRKPAQWLSQVGFKAPHGIWQLPQNNLFTNQGDGELFFPRMSLPILAQTLLKHCK